MLELYQMLGCPFCQKVRIKLDELGLDYICRTAPRGSKQREFMVKIGGKEQVPFLIDVSKNLAIYESDYIINYLEENYRIIK